MTTELFRKSFFRPFAFFLAVLSIFSAEVSALAQEESLQVIQRWTQWSDPGHSLIHYLNGVAFCQLDQRDREIATLRTANDWRLRQQKVKRILNELLGPWPEKTPLNARVTGTVKQNGYRIEKIVYESQPRFYVTGCLFIPDGLKGKSPAILNVIGHTDISFRGKLYQQLILNLVKKKFIVFAIDPIGQGERLQYFDPEKGQSVVGRATSEHSYVGRQCFIAGTSLAGYFTWDGIRAVDYLLTRPEVDPQRIGITGISGGGTQTSYIWATDDRLAAAAPTCYITGFRRLLESIGPQDAEQNILHAVGRGITHADFLEARAPRPALIVATTRDFFSIQGARETFREVEAAYRALGAADQIGIAEDDFEHGYTALTRQAIYSFFQKTLRQPGNPADEEVTLLDPAELKVTQTGQVSTSLSGESAFTLVRTKALGLLEKIAEARKNPEVHLDRVRRQAQILSGYSPPDDAVDPVFRGRYQREGYTVEMWALPGDGEIVTPVLMFVPSGTGPFPGLIYLNPKSKSADAGAGGEIEKLVRRGFLVASPDVSGTGELADESESTSFTGVLTGKSVVGVQAADIVRVVKLLLRREEVAGGRIFAAAFEESCPALLHAAAFEPSIAGVALLRGPVSYGALVTNRFYKFDFAGAVPAALTAYDLPDLAACLAPRKLVLAGTLDQMQEPLPEGQAAEQYSFARSRYLGLDAGGNFRIESGPAGGEAEAITGWFSD
ncbi:MAG: alpha/beta hydrolase family protein [Candidatus Glassbacteria bacterium]